MKFSPLVLDDYIYPAWANILGWFLSFASIFCIPGYFLYHLATQVQGTLREVMTLHLSVTSNVSCFKRNALNLKFDL